MGKSGNPKTIPSDKCATLAEIEYRKVGTLGRRQLNAALDVGRLMSSAKEQLEHGKWKPTVQRWRDEGRIGDKLAYLTYVTPESESWWSEYANKGAILL